VFYYAKNGPKSFADPTVGAYGALQLRPAIVGWGGVNLIPHPSTPTAPRRLWHLVPWPPPAQHSHWISWILAYFRIQFLCTPLGRFRSAITNVRHLRRRRNVKIWPKECKIHSINMKNSISPYIGLLLTLSDTRWRRGGPLRRRAVIGYARGLDLATVETFVPQTPGWLEPAPMGLNDATIMCHISA